MIILMCDWTKERESKWFDYKVNICPLKYILKIYFKTYLILYGPHTYY